MAEYKRENKLNLLSAWAKAEGIDVECEIRTGNGADGAGIYATSETSIGQTLVRVPSKRVLTRATVIEYAETRPVFKKLLYRTVRGEEFKDNETLDGVSDKDVLTRFFIFEILTSRRGDAGNDDPWKVWVESLPTLGEMKLPISWDRQDVEDLVGTSIYEATLSKINFLKFRYSSYFESQEIRTIVSEYVSSGPSPDTSLETNTEITFQDWLLIESWIASRSLEVIDQSTAGKAELSLCLGLVPIVDMCNHSNAANAKYELDEKTSDVSLVATKAIAKGEQVFINYGEEKGSGEMLFSYGFMPSATNARVATFTIPDLIGGDEAKDEESMVLMAKDKMFGARPRLLKVSQLDPAVQASWTSDYITFLALLPTDFSFVKNAEDEGQTVLFRDTLVDFDDIEGSLSKVLDSGVRDRATYMAESLVRDVFEADLADEEGAGHGLSPHALVELEKALLASLKFV